MEKNTPAIKNGWGKKSSPRRYLNHPSNTSQNVRFFSLFLVHAW